MATNNNNLLASIDIGTKNTRVLFAMLEDDNTIQIEGYGKAISRGVREGRIVNINEVTASIEDAINQAQKRSGYTIMTLNSSISDHHLTINNRKGERVLQDEFVSQKDIDFAVNSAAIPVPTNKQIINTIVTRYSIANQDINQFEKVQNPLNMQARVLEVKTHNISVSTSAINLIIEGVRRSNKAEVKDFFIESMACSEAILTDDLKERGVVIVNIGAGVTSYTIFIDGELINSGIVAIGGNNITEDICEAFGLEFDVADELKMSYGKVESSISESDKLIPVNAKIQGKLNTQYLSSKDLYEVISGSCKSILEELKFNIFENNSIKSNRIKSGVVLTGGSSELFELEGLSRKIFHLPVKKGLINRNIVKGDEKIITNSEFSTSIGLLLCRRDEGGLEPIEATIKRENFGSKMKDLFKKF
jgi:cell division protein FtsA